MRTVVLYRVDDSDAVVARLLHLRTLQMILDIGKRLAVEIRVAEHASVRRNQRDPRR